ncbi:MAG: hypothetical protein M1839_003047 [Geoglossum umbratile]|nr:MAG: hypothetical protein M1839_003047 [Geoglossum umbratile]
MKSLTVIRDPDLRTEIQDLPIPQINENQILIRVVVAGANPKDWKHPDPGYFGTRINQGDDIAGFVHALGGNVRGFALGERVAAMHQMGTEGGGYAEYAVAWKHTVFRIPDRMGFEEQASYTAAVALYLHLRLPAPWARNPTPIPLLINGVSSATGSYAAKFARLNPSITPIIGTAGASSAYASTLNLDTILDYRSPSLATDAQAALHGTPLTRILDTANSPQSALWISALVSPGATYAFTQRMDPDTKASLASTGVELSQIWVGTVHDDPAGVGQDFGAVWAGFLARLLEDGRLAGHPFEVVEGGLSGVEAGLKRLMGRRGGDNRKLVFR